MSISMIPISYNSGVDKSPCFSKSFFASKKTKCSISETDKDVIDLGNSFLVFSKNKIASPLRDFLGLNIFLTVFVFLICS